MLVAGYLQARKLPVLWYDVDNGDSDPATFFQYLRLAAGNAARGRTASAVLAPEHLADLPGFARRFFRDLYSGMRDVSAIVFDNYHEVPLDSSFHMIMEQALAEIPEGISVIVVSRAEPPANYSRHIANGAMAQVDPSDLGLTFDETSSIALATQRLDADTLRLLHRQAGGWVAGLTLMLDQLMRTGTVDFSATAETMETVFCYFADQIFNDLPAAERDILLHTSFLPLMTVEMAKEISGNPDAGRVLEEFYRRHLFTDRRPGERSTYHYHALFRAFLLAKADDAYALPRFVEIRQRAARLMQNDRHFEEAVALYQEALDWTAATALIIAQAPAEMMRGKRHTVKKWISAMPEHIVEATPWLLYWLGACDIAVDPARARISLQRAFSIMKEQNDIQGQMAAAARVVDTYYLEWADFSALDRWIGELEHLLGQQPEFASKQAELPIVCAMLVATMSRQPRHPMLPKCADRVMSLMQEELAVNDVVTAGTFLLHYYCNVGLDLANAARVVARIGPLLSLSELAPFKRVVWLSRYARYSSFRAEFEVASDSFKQALEILDREGLAFYAPVVQTHQLLMSMTLADTSLARSLVAKLVPAIDPARRIDLAILVLVKSWIALQEANLAQALSHGRSALSIASEAGAVTIQGLCLLALAAASSEQQDDASARDYIEQARIRSPLLAARQVQYFALLLQAKSADDRGRPSTAGKHLRSAFAMAKEERFVNMAWHPRLVAWSCEFALENRIEVDYVRERIRKCAVLPRGPEVENWPWPIRIYTMGRFGVIKEGEALTFAGKAQARPLDLLKVLIALGGRNVDFGTLMGLLWPDPKVDAQKSLEMTLSRLRKLLGRNDVILMHEHKLTLNPRVVWVDAWAFERLLSRMEEQIGGGAKAVRTAWDVTAARAFQLYRGRFLEREARFPWMQASTDRLQAKFVRLVMTLGRKREQISWDQAAHIYERGLEVDNLAEELYRRLVICYRERGQIAEALNVYRRCRENLSITLGVAPSPDTVSLYNTLL